MNWITTLQGWPWTLIGSVAAAVAGGVWTVFAFVHERREDRRWRQVEFLLDLNQRFMDSEAIRKCIRRLDDTHEVEDLQQLFGTDRQRLNREQLSDLEDFRSFFQFFDNLSRCADMGALTLDQVDIFGWQLYRVNHVDCLRTYCRNHGFQRILSLADKLERHVYANARNG